MTTETLQTAMRLLTLLDQERPSQEVTVETIIKEERKMFKKNECPDPIDIDEASRILGKTIATVYKYMREGRLTKFKSLNKAVVSKAQVQGLLEPKEV